MINKGDKGGQFYLVAALVIIVIIIGFVAVSNYSSPVGSSKLYDFGEELGIESQNILDYGTYNEFDEVEMNELLNNFSESYVNYSGGGKDLYFLFGNREKITIAGYQDLSSEIFVSFGNGEPSSLQLEGGEYVSREFNPEGERKVIITINDAEYEFKLSKGENFYFIISQEIGGEQYVITN